MKKILSALFLLTVVFVVGSKTTHAATEDEYSNGFITTWKTDNPGVTASNQIRIPTTGGGYLYDVDWGDGTFTNGITGIGNHTYASPGTYTVRIAGSFPRIYFNAGGDRRKILTVQQWGDNAWTSMSQAFAGASNLNVIASDTPNLSGVTSLNSMFVSASSLNANLNAWGVSNVTDISFMFAEATQFNSPLNAWDVSSVTDMRSMFTGATAFNQPLNSWNTVSVSLMSSVFSNASSFNQNISTWNTSSVTEMSNLFQGASSYNQPLYPWNTANVTTMSSMFDGATSFNQTLYAWNTGNVTDMSYMFNGATSFNQNLSSWNVVNLITADTMFPDSGLSTTNYDAILNSWSQQAVQNNVFFGAGTIQYCDAAARDILTNTYSWSITDGGLTTCDTAAPVISGELATISTSSVVISFTTDEDTTSTVEYGVTTTYGATSTISVATTTSEVTITGLTPNTLYYYLITSSDASSNSATSTGTFTTSALLVVAAPVVETPIANRVSYGSGGGYATPNRVTYSTTTRITVPISTTGLCSPYLTEIVPIKVGGNNNIEEVKRIQTFLNEYEKTNLVVDGVYKLVDEQAVKVFQRKYLTQILSPWGLMVPTGIVHTTTRAKINALICGQNLGCPVFTQKTDTSSAHGDVVKVKNLLNQILGLKLNTQSSVVDPATTRAITQFQTKYTDFVLKPLGLKRATGLWYESTIKQANAFMGCTL